MSSKKPKKAPTADYAVGLRPARRRPNSRPASLATLLAAHGAGHPSTSCCWRRRRASSSSRSATRSRTWTATAR
jgi:hypothetical protein